MDFDFISEAVKRFDEDDTIKPAFIAAVEELSSQLASKDLNEDYKPYATVGGFSSVIRLCADHVVGTAEPCAPRIYCIGYHGIVDLQCLQRRRTV